MSLLHRDDVGAMHHDVGDAALVQAEDVAQHGALDRREAGVVRRRGIEHDLEIVAHRSRLPAEQACEWHAAASLSAVGRITSPECTTTGKLAVLRGLS